MTHLLTLRFNLLSMHHLAKSLNFVCKNLASSTVLISWIFFQNNQNGGQVQNGEQWNFLCLIFRERIKFFSICLWIWVFLFYWPMTHMENTFFKIFIMVDKFKMADKGIFYVWYLENGWSLFQSVFGFEFVILLALNHGIMDFSKYS
jgi:hypothetical protein